MATMPQRQHHGGRSLHKLYAAVATVAAALLASVGTAQAAAQAACPRPPEPAELIAEVPWAQDWLAPERVWPLSRGDGVVVAVVDSGVDTRHPQLRDARVLDGTDLLPEPAGAHTDCDSHGTAVASIINASRIDGVGFHGLAPAAAVLPVRVAEAGVEAASAAQEPPVSPGRLATAVTWAADNGADIINLSIVFYSDHQEIADAIDYALQRGVIVVAAVGNPVADDEQHPTPYPAAYPGVIGVGALAADGTAPGGLVSSSHVDLVAPGVSVTAAAAVDGHRQWTGSSFAAPFVSAAAALLLAAEPELTTSEVIDRLLATADPGPGARRDSGAGVVNPYRALTERVSGRTPVAAEPPPAPVVDPAAEARAERWQVAGQHALLVATGTAALVLLLVVAGRVWRAGRRHGWRPVRRPAEPAPAISDDPDRQPERRFFTVPNRRDDA